MTRPRRSRSVVQREDVRASLVDEGVRLIEVDGWLDAWARDNDGQFWLLAHDWIIGQVRIGRKPPNALPDEPDRVATAMRAGTRSRLLAGGMSEHDAERWLAAWDDEHVGAPPEDLWDGALKWIDGQVALTRRPGEPPR